MSDLVQRLRDRARYETNSINLGAIAALLTEAADAIERQRELLTKLATEREALFEALPGCDRLGCGALGTRGMPHCLPFCDAHGESCPDLPWASVVRSRASLDAELARVLGKETK